MSTTLKDGESFYIEPGWRHSRTTFEIATEREIEAIELALRAGSLNPCHREKKIHKSHSYTYKDPGKGYSTIHDKCRYCGKFWKKPIRFGAKTREELTSRLEDLRKRMTE